MSCKRHLLPTGLSATECSRWRQSGAASWAQHPQIHPTICSWAAQQWLKTGFSCSDHQANRYPSKSQPKPCCFQAIHPAAAVHTLGAIHQTSVLKAGKNIDLLDLETWVRLLTSLTIVACKSWVPRLDDNQNHNHHHYHHHHHHHHHHRCHHQRPQWHNHPHQLAKKLVGQAVHHQDWSTFRQLQAVQHLHQDGFGRFNSPLLNLKWKHRETCVVRTYLEAIFNLQFQNLTGVFLNK